MTTSRISSTTPEPISPDKQKCNYHNRVFENGEKINPKELDYDKQLESCVEDCMCQNNTIVCYQINCEEIFIDDPKRCRKVKYGNHFFIK